LTFIFLVSLDHLVLEETSVTLYWMTLMTLV